MTPSPLLTISIPTYNRSQRLKIMLEALIPQAIECGDQVDIVISDNASRDDTRQLIEEFTQQFPIRYIHNGVNLGGILNIILAGNRGLGEYVWILGDDDILYPGRLQEIVETIKLHPQYDIFVLNTRGAVFQEHWPTSAVGGYAGEFSYLLNETLTDTEFKTWEESLLPTNGFGTQIYISIVRSCKWREYWQQRRVDQATTDEHDIFPHSIFIARTFIHQPCYYIGQPALTTFDGAQCWNHLAAWITLVKLPELLKIYKKTGVPNQRISAIRKFFYYSLCGSNLEDNFREGICLEPTWMFLKANMFHFMAWPTLIFVILKVLLLNKEVRVVSWSALWIETCRRTLPQGLFNSIKAMIRKSS